MSRLAKELVKVRKLDRFGAAGAAGAGAAGAGAAGGGRDDYGFIVELAPVDESDLSRWYAVIEGPAGTPYEGHNFKLAIAVPAGYPMVPPEFKFEATRDGGFKVPPHCNVDRSTGEICLDILKPAGWTPIWDLLHVTQAVYILLQEPEPDSPLDVDMAQITRSNDKGALYGIVNYYLS
ncbi:Ubiquitin-conjugating enzyme E2-21 kDa [Nakaseomyces bracarensis]|uniref:Ubiquitin-conjugating enzyme E2-21 kDa n=1 Tax=Nakaseomyces bracarensis TaxID=273131 RepID=A0ABR4NPE5_9SACH